LGLGASPEGYDLTGRLMATTPQAACLPRPCFLRLCSVRAGPALRRCWGQAGL